MPKHSTLESGHHQSQEKRAHKHLFRTASSPHFNQHGVVASRGAKPPIHVEFKMVVASHVVFIQCPASCPRLRQEYGRHQRTHPPQFATRQASPLSNVVAHRWQTTVATRLNRVKMTNKKKTNSMNAEGKGKKKKTKGKIKDEMTRIEAEIRSAFASTHTDTYTT